jgi:hypothetical protein
LQSKNRSIGVVKGNKCCVLWELWEQIGADCVGIWCLVLIVGNR